ncbi:MAG: nickel pincer cofactor biosynthesis protein LarC [Desulfosarcina sp.]
MHAYFDCFCGISGDMVLGAFVDMGVPPQWLMEQIRGLSIGEVEIAVQDVKQSGIGAKKISVVEKQTSHARNYRDILTIIENGAIPEAVKAVAVDIFGRIADAEARIHRCEKEAVHFHEVGAVDSIVDIVGTALCLDHLKIESASASPLPLGSGFVACAHGKLPVPAPATLEILKNTPVYGGPSTGECVTPTGAGIVTALADTFGPIPAMRIERIGYGSGSREFGDVPNLLRVILGKKLEPMPGMQDDVVVLTTNIDDMNPEVFGYLMEKLFHEGALDVCYTPIIMKKNRPGTRVEVLCSADIQPTIMRCLLTETSTIGVRYQQVHRHVLKRSVGVVSTAYGRIRVKQSTDPDGRMRYAPEYEACKTAAMTNQVPLKVVYEAVADAIRVGHGSDDIDGPQRPCDS